MGSLKINLYGCAPLNVSSAQSIFAFVASS